MRTARPYYRAIAVWLAIMAAESIHGTLRELLLKPWIGDMRARQLSFFTGLAIIFFLTFLLIGWIGATVRRDLILIGLLWAILTFCFEMGIGILAIGMTLEQTLADYDLLQGRLMALGLMAMALIPLAAFKLRRKKGE